MREEMESMKTPQNKTKLVHTHLTANMMRGAVMITSKNRGADNVSIALFSVGKIKEVLI